MKDGLQYFYTAEPVALEQMLEAREIRASMQKELIRRYRKTLICFTMNIPGQYKAYPLVEQGFKEGSKAVRRQLERHGVKTLLHRQTSGVTGYESYRVVDCTPERAKELLLHVEREHPLGRLFDFDVLDRHGQCLRGADFGRDERTCLICGGPVWQCARNRAHTAQELSHHVAKMLDRYFSAQFADKLAGMAVRALLHEVCVTPKPGLVDRVNNGAHKDMTIFTFIDSGAVLYPYFREVTLRSLRFGRGPEELLETLRPLGQQAEDDMMEATGGVNTHKGLIFSAGILCAAMGYLRGHGKNKKETPSAVLDLCAKIAGGVTDEFTAEAEGMGTKGVQAHQRYGLTGIRGEAAAGFPSVRSYGYPVLKELTSLGFSYNDAGVAALLHLMAGVTDTNIVGRSDLETQRQVQKLAREASLLQDHPGLLLEAAAQLDAELVAKNLSPGGCADLLALSFLLLFWAEQAAI